MREPRSAVRNKANSRSWCNVEVHASPAHAENSLGILMLIIPITTYLCVFPMVAIVGMGDPLRIKRIPSICATAASNFAVIQQRTRSTCESNQASILFGTAADACYEQSIDKCCR